MIQEMLSHSANPYQLVQSQLIKPVKWCLITKVSHKYLMGKTKELLQHTCGRIVAKSTNGTGYRRISKLIIILIILL